VSTADTEEKGRREQKREIKQSEEWRGEKNVVRSIMTQPMSGGEAGTEACGIF